MSKKNKGHRNNTPIQPKPQKPEPVTMETISETKTQSEFDVQKEQLLTELKAEINRLEDQKKKLAFEIEGIRKNIEMEKSKLNDVQEEIKPLNDQLSETQKQLSETKAQKEKMEEEASTIIDEANLKAHEIIETANKDAASVLQEKINELSAEKEELRRKTNELREKEHKLHEQEDDCNYDREELEIQKLNLQKRKELYESASPSKVESLEAELHDSQERYEALKTKYEEQSARMTKLELMLDEITTDTGHDVKSLLNEFARLNSRNEELEQFRAKYPDENRLQLLEYAEITCENLEKENEELHRFCTGYKEQLKAYANSQRELESVRREIEATDALNDHLLKELESHKTALESRTGDTCPALTKVDSEVETHEFNQTIVGMWKREKLTRLEEIVTQVRDFAGNNRLYYTADDIRAFLAGMAVSRLLILQGMSGTGKSSLPRIFSEAISGFNRLIPVESSWRDRNELLGYYNDFNKKFNAKSFTIELYRSGRDKCTDIPTFIVLDEMNLARMEYYFSDFLAILQEPNPENWLIELVSSDMRTLPSSIPSDIEATMKKDAPDIYSIWERTEKSRNGDVNASTSDEEKSSLANYLEKQNLLTGAKSLIDGRKIKVNENVWFIGTSNKDESTFEITDKVYDRAQVLSLDKKGVSEGVYNAVNKKQISVNDLLVLFSKAKNSFGEKDNVKKGLDKLDNLLMEHFDVSFGNRILNQSIEFTAVFQASGGSIETALDYQISTKILRKVIMSDNKDALENFQLFAEESGYKKTQKLIEKRIKDLK
jgi:hypothetical protein